MKLFSCKNLHQFFAAHGFVFERGEVFSSSLPESREQVKEEMKQAASVTGLMQLETELRATEAKLQEIEKNKFTVRVEKQKIKTELFPIICKLGKAIAGFEPKNINEKRVLLKAMATANKIVKANRSDPETTALSDTFDMRAYELSIIEVPGTLPTREEDPYENVRKTIGNLDSLLDNVKTLFFDFRGERTLRFESGNRMHWFNLSNMARWLEEAKFDVDPQNESERNELVNQIDATLKISEESFEARKVLRAQVPLPAGYEEVHEKTQFEDQEKLLTRRSQLIAMQF